MRTPINANPGMTPSRIVSSSIAVDVDVYRSQPGSPGPDGTTPVGRLTIAQGTLTDDASRTIQRTATYDLASTVPSWLAPGMWLMTTIGIQGIQPLVYRLPTLAVTDVDVQPSDTAYGTINAADPAEILNGRPYTVDTTLSGTLRTLVGGACSVALSRPTDVTGVPDLAIPPESIGEFGTGRWDKCVTVADSLGVVLRFTDTGDVVGRLRSDPYPGATSVVELTGERGRSYAARTPTHARVIVDRGDQIGLIGAATAAQVTGTPPPTWYPTYVVTDHASGTTTTTQAQADTLALDLLRARYADVDTYTDVNILPAPWLEAGADVVTWRGATYGVRAFNLDLPSLATTLTLRRIL